MYKNMLVRFVLILLASAMMFSLGCGSTALPIATITISNDAGVDIPPTFMGFSEEWGHIQTMIGDSEVGVNETYRQLLRNLTAYGSGPLMMRIGGDTTDDSSWPTETTVRPFAELAGATNTHFYLGVNFKFNNLPLATAQTQNYLSHMPSGSVDAIEIGNEPDVYLPDYEPYMERFNRWKSQLMPLLPSGTKLMGPAWYYLPLIQAHTGDFLDSVDGAVVPFTLHLYTGQASYSLPDDWLLLPSTARIGPRDYGPIATECHQHGVPFRVGEMNSLGGGGKAGISDTFQSALWAIDIMFDFASLGVDGVNWHNGKNSRYAAFTIAPHVSDTGMTTYVTTVHPLYYGLLLFQQATGNHSHLLQENLWSNANFKAWATVDEQGIHRLVIVNKDENRHGTVRVKIAGYQHAQVARLVAKDYLSKDGVTLAGQTFDNSPDGKPVGTRTTDSYDLIDGAFDIPIGVTSAALVTFQK